jgi:hypothetical protein
VTMSKGISCLFFLAVGVAIGGCSKGPPEDNLMLERIATIEKIAALYEKVTDKASFQATEPQIQPLGEKLTKVNEQFEALPPETKQAALDKHAGALEAAMSRLKAAKTNAATVAFGAKAP